MDTTYRFWIFPSWGIGAGWGLGSFPLFDEWIKGLPDSSQNIVRPGHGAKKLFRQGAGRCVYRPVAHYDLLDAVDQRAKLPFF